MIVFVSGRFGERGLVTLAVVVSLIEFSAVMDGAGMAVPPMIGTYYGEKDHVLIKRIMRSDVKPPITAPRIVSLGFTFCSAVSLTTSYYVPQRLTTSRIV